MSNADSESFPPIIELNVGGVFYTTTLSTLTREPDSLLGQMFTGLLKNMILKDTKGKYFIDRDGVLFRYVLDYLRNQKLVLPENFHERERLKCEAEYFRLNRMIQCVQAAYNVHAPYGHGTQQTNKNNALLQMKHSSINESTSDIGKPGFLIIGYRGTFAFGRDGLADVKFRKLSRILVSGRVSFCREVFGDTLNESRDPDRGLSDRYTSRFFLKHTFLEQAFDMLMESGFRMCGACGSGTNASGELKPGMDSEENRWQHYNEFVFQRL
ncbi:BTB/POZ domain-containing protein KCTD12-like [Tubulanus polymorphus]|uniref:BTB/POZ domain-containing protein KCTD12-like n=1 Tax=Tubulanus polymorphus TaxID=672921 RepID=UPI003DA271CC